MHRPCITSLTSVDDCISMHCDLPLVAIRLSRAHVRGKWQETDLGAVRCGTFLDEPGNLSDTAGDYHLSATTLPRREMG
jgi:hypothetical protein